MMQLLPLILEVAPFLASAVAGGKAGEVVAAGAKIAQEVFGTDDPATIGAAVADNPAIAEQFRNRLEAETARLRAELEDVQDARRQTVTLVQAGSSLAWAPAVLSLVIILAFVAMCFAMLFKAVPDSAVAQMLFGQLAGMTGAVVQYWLGSSVGSRSKDQVLAAAAAPGQVIAKAAAAVVKRR